MLEILTPLTKVERVSRQIDPSTFVAEPGIWAQVNAKINKLVIGSASQNPYESHDIEVGRITTMESFGVRCKVDTVGYSGVIADGDFLVVSSAASTLGVLMSTAAVAAGTYEIVARAEEVNTVAGYIVFRTVSPTMITI